MSNESILINGRTYDFSSTRLTVFGLKRVGFTSIDYSHKLERGEGRGASQVPLAKSRGKYTADPVKITFHKSSGEELRQHIAGKSRTGKSLGQVEGIITLQFVDDLLGTQTVVMKKVLVNNDGSVSAKEGSDAITEDWEFDVRLMSKNGITLYESDEPGA